MRRTWRGSLTSYVWPLHRSVVGFRVRRRPEAMTQGTAIAATADRHAGTLHAAATVGAAEKRARRRRDAVAIETGSGAQKNTAGIRQNTAQIASRAKDARRNGTRPVNQQTAASPHR